jgi:hypothetical protein
MPKRRRRSFIPPFKAQLVLEVLTGVPAQVPGKVRHPRRVNPGRGNPG